MNCSCFLCRSGIHRTRIHFYVVNGFLVDLWQLSYVFVYTSADQNQRLSPVVLHGVDLNFNSLTFQVIRNFDIQNWANLYVPSSWIFYHLEEISTRTNASKCCNFNNTNCKHSQCQHPTECSRQHISPTTSKTT